MALEKQCSQFLMRGLGITAYDAESDAGVVYEDIITSEYYSDAENYTHAFGKLGTVFSIRAYGYRAYVESTADDPLAEAHAVKFEGASRICVYPKDTHYPLQIVAYLGRSSSGSEIKPTFFPGYYLTEDSASPNVSGMASTAPTLPDRWYITATYGNSFGEDELTFWASTTPDFSDVTGNYWPIAITIVTRKKYLSSSNPDADWILQYIEPIEYDGTDDSGDSTTSIDPKYMLMGWLVGRRIAGQRQKHPELPDGVLISSDGYILTDCNGVYLIAAAAAEPDEPENPDAPAVPDEPGEVATMYLYGTPSESGNIGLRVGDTVTYYDGAVLPSIESVWTPELQAEYPVVYIYTLLDWNYLNIGKGYSYRYEDEKYKVYLTGYYGSYTAHDEGWGSFYDGEDGEKGIGEVQNFASMPWTNTPILHEDGTIAKAATTPIPVGDIVEYINNIPIYEQKEDS